MYATRDDMVKRFGEKEVIALTDRDYTGQIDDTVLSEALADAGVEIDGYIGGRYPLPLAQPPKILTGYACDIARYRLCGSSTQLTEDIRDRYRDAVKFLELAANGKVTLGGMPGGGPAPTDNTVQFASGSRVFARDGGAF
ncbi:gp436 family protein [Pseudogulbenkiania sp. MAI-1]|uniref:gp436 family protein n=1 Tax=Pseudogulbenkiania sp. MAI-1 TaxID=990370 RepID=UPI00045EAC2D|nr:phage protein Gp36 family protein [Pseudogulbenkiania sp. MAI-1]